MRLTIGRVISLVAAVAGAIGTLLLYKGSFAFVQLGGWADDKLVAETIERNRKLQLRQRLGLTFILAGFILGGVAQFFD